MQFSKPAADSHCNAPENPAGQGRIQVKYSPAAAGSIQSPGLLAVIRFGATPTQRETSAEGGPLRLDVRLKPLNSPPYVECWLANGAVRQGRRDSIRYAHDGDYLFAVAELDEREHSGVCAAAEALYAQINRFQQVSGFPHLLRIWNYLDAINEGNGDAERYRQFCMGRAAGFVDIGANRFPAASAIGHRHTTHMLQVYWLASRTPGTHVENPRQVSAYRYPRTHGPVSPSFARATLAADGTLLISGTASIVGHLSMHAGDPLAQLDETLRNLAALGAPVLHASDHAGALPSSNSVLLKAYVRDTAHVDAIAQRVQAAFPDSPVLYLAADICRRELLLEIEMVRLGVCRT